MKNTTKLLFGSLILSGIGITAYLGNTNSDVSIEKYVPREEKFSKEMASKQSTEHFEKLIGLQYARLKNCLIIIKQ